MHIRELFQYQPRRDIYAEWNSDVPHEILEIISSVIVGLLGCFLAAAMYVYAVNGGNLLKHPPTFFWWILPSALMTPFTLWRIAFRLRTMPSGMVIQSFVWRNVHLEEGITGWKVLLYLVKAYLPALSWLCIIAGICSMLSCSFHVRRASLLPPRQ
ncbi:MAG: hypothetical protein A2845_03925 [Candidatus Lloydbacteria bacterium RIFCSPHIGHO2_01_FULL_49_22]|uniref:Uncharacterized protein n=1 Tax=Candidatus Lloydbacteria bacterium RIFCSPHIGHO2_01_FULL_49_22 TaxID=1798658 RepID=A0A1G2CXG7_9BACT|nr:MAG: hypothetical protein A2845_03925 [Candidatus Lloydbacteria bacterium RIFCSPHIGHO2_01_FULL_49_22]OGZ09075.1 MAG: hypothetical protein A3C14_03760 [Candidatus Lloydbacteria bacterium RIFCSPHIGHO2_02_FULL_50_18]